MSAGNEIQCYEYVSRPYQQVRDALAHDGIGLFQRATTSAAERANTLVTKLKVSIAGFDVGRNVIVTVSNVNRNASAPGMSHEATELDIEWHAEKSAALFPAMRAKLTIYPLSSDETQLQIIGDYVAPGGVFGSVADDLIGRRIAAASVHSFLDALAVRLNTEVESVEDF